MQFGRCPTFEEFEKANSKALLNNTFFEKQLLKVP
jgi:hypothetical protein